MSEARGSPESLYPGVHGSASNLPGCRDEELPVIDLGSTWSFTYMMRTQKPAVAAGEPHAQSQYEHAIHPVADVSNTEEFWGVYAHMKRVGELPLNTDCHVFRQGIKPVWEDDANARGGKWMIRLRKNLAARLWEHLVRP